MYDAPISYLFTQMHLQLAVLKLFVYLCVFFCLPLFHSLNSLTAEEHRTMKYANFLDAVIFFPSYVWISDDTFNVRFMNLVVVSIDVMYMCICIHNRIPYSCLSFFLV